MVSSFPLCMFVLTVCGAAEGRAWGCRGAGGESALEGGEVQALRHVLLAVENEGRSEA